MQQFQQPQQQLKTRKPLLIFLKGGGAPIVLYVENPDEAFEEVKDLIKKASNSSPKLIEKIGNGPLKKIAMLDTQISGVALQEEQHMM